MTIGNHNFEVAGSFTYLGTSIDSENNVSEEIKRRTVAASRCTYGLNKYIRSQYIGRKTKIQIYRTLIKPVLTYACETWRTLSRTSILCTSLKEKCSGRSLEASTRMRYGEEDKIPNYMSYMIAQI